MCENFTKELLISVVIPVWNTEKFLRCCIDSVINQTYRNLEIILVDDGSTDNSPEICDEYASKDRRIVVLHKENGGVGSARNAGMKIAKGDYITFVDSDDFIDLNMYEKMIQVISKDLYDLIICGMKIQNTVGDFNVRQFNKSDSDICCTERKEIVKLFRKFRENSKNFAELHSPCNKLIKMNLIKDMVLAGDSGCNVGGGYNENMLTLEDAVFSTECFNRAASVCVLNKSFYNYIYNEHSACHEQKPVVNKNRDGSNDLRIFILTTYNFYKNNGVPMRYFKKYLANYEEYISFGFVYGNFFSLKKTDDFYPIILIRMTPLFLLKNFRKHKKEVIKLVICRIGLYNYFRKLKYLMKR